MAAATVSMVSNTVSANVPIARFKGREKLNGTGQRPGLQVIQVQDVQDDIAELRFRIGISDHFRERAGVSPGPQDLAGRC